MSTENAWSAPQRPIEYVEEKLITAILDGKYPPNTSLPGERTLAAQLGVTRPTLREVLRRLERDGWLTIRQGKSTRVNDIWTEGGLNVLSAIVRYSKVLPPSFVDNLLNARAVLAPAYTQLALENDPAQVIALLEQSASLPDTPAAYASYDWELHHTLTIASGNPIYTLILNGFADFYQHMALFYFANPQARQASQAFYAQLLQCARGGGDLEADRLAREMMLKSVQLWKQTELQ